GEEQVVTGDQAQSARCPFAAGGQATARLGTVPRTMSADGKKATRSGRPPVRVPERFQSGQACDWQRPPPDGSHEVAPDLPSPLATCAARAVAPISVKS